MFSRIAKLFHCKNKRPTADAKSSPPRLEAERPEEKRLAMFNSIPIPLDFNDEIIELDLLIDPVTTPSTGHCFTRAGVHALLESKGRHPITRKPFTADDIKEVPDIARLMDAFTTLRTNTQDTITRATSDTDARATMAAYESKLGELTQQISSARQTLITQAVQRARIQEIKDRLRIDFTNGEHLDYWCQKGKSGTRMPDHVAAMMTAARHTYDNVDTFVAAIDRARQIERCSRFFKDPFRDPQTIGLYNAADLRTFSVR